MSVFNFYYAMIAFYLENIFLDEVKKVSFWKGIEQNNSPDL